MSGWYLRAGRERDYRYAIIDKRGVHWTATSEAASRFDTKAEATIVQSEIVAELGITVACISDCPRPSK